MRIGIDFDNTIVSYDALFYKVAVEQALDRADLRAVRGDDADLAEDDVVPGGELLDDVHNLLRLHRVRLRRAVRSLVPVGDVHEREGYRGDRPVEAHRRAARRGRSPGE